MASARLNLTLPNAGGAVGKWTYSFWLKRSAISEQTIVSPFFSTSFFGGIKFTSSDALEVFDYRNSYLLQKITNRVFRDTTAWYHFVINNDSTVSSPETEIYVNGVKVTSFSTLNEYSQNDTNSFNNDYMNTIGAYNSGAAQYFDGQLAHFHYVSGTKYSATDFGEFDSNGVWKPKTSPSITYGNNGCFLKFDNDSNMGLDSSGQNNNWTVNGTIIQNKDTPSNNSTTINKLDRRTNDMTVTNAGNTGESNASVYTPGTMNLGADSGKWYWEVKVASKTGSSDWHLIGIMGQTRRESNVYLGQVVDQYGYYGLNGLSYTNNSGSTFGDAYGVGNIIGVAMDLDNNKLYFHKDGVYQNSGDPTSGSTGTGAISITAASATDDGFYRPAICYFDGSTKATYQCNFGNGYFGTTKITSAGSNGNGSLFEFDVPAGYYALNTRNLKEQS